jgi:hypothetical protein
VCHEIAVRHLRLRVIKVWISEMPMLLPILRIRL